MSFDALGSALTAPGMSTADAAQNRAWGGRKRTCSVSHVTRPCTSASKPVARDAC